MTTGRLLIGATPLGHPSDASARLVKALASAAWVVVVPAGVRPKSVGIAGGETTGAAARRLSLIHISEPTRPY